LYAGIQAWARLLNDNKNDPEQNVCFYETIILNILFTHLMNKFGIFLFQILMKTDKIKPELYVNGMDKNISALVR